MRAMSSVASVTIHLALGATVLLGTADSGRSNPTTRHQQLTVVFPQEDGADREGRVGLPAPQIPSSPDLPSIPLPATVLQSGAPNQPFASTSTASSPTTGSGQAPSGWGFALGEAGPEVLTGPLPVYPEPLRQAGIQGQVVLEAWVDTTGRVQAASISVIAVTHPGFVASARQALLATLFRPGRIGGRAVAMRVRVPFAFRIRSGTGRAR